MSGTGTCSFAECWTARTWNELQASCWRPCATRIWSSRPRTAASRRGGAAGRSTPSTTAPSTRFPTIPKLLDTATTQRFLLRVFGEPVFTFRSLTVRYALPADDRHISLPHQDHFFIRHTAAFRTLWVPLLPIEPPGGALAVAAGSHRAGLRRHEETDVLSYVLKGRRQRGLPLAEVPQPWHTTTYRPGDALIFHSHTLHWALPNESQSVRLSVDVRCQPASEPRSWQSRTTVPEQRELRRAAQAIAAAEGMSEDLFEKVIIEMMAQGVPAERERMIELAAALG